MPVLTNHNSTKKACPRGLSEIQPFLSIDLLGKDISKSPELKRRQKVVVLYTLLQICS